MRLASCCSVEVVNGAAGRRVYGRSCTERTATAAFAMPAATASAIAWSRCTTSLVRSSPVSAKSRPVATRRPSTPTRRAVKLDAGSPWGETSATTSQYDAARKAIRSRSRSTTSRVATDCTRPADRPWRTLRQSTGLTS